MSRLETTADIGVRIIKALAGLWFGVIGIIGSSFLYNEFTNSEASRSVKYSFPVSPVWNNIAIILVAVGALVFFYIAFKLIRGALKRTVPIYEKENEQSNAK